jgi:hypothetical protein
MNTLEPLKLVSLSYDNIIFRKTKNIKNKKIIFLKYKNKLKESNFVIQLSKLINTNIIEKNIMELKITNDDDIKYLNELDNFIILYLRNNNIGNNWFVDNNTTPINYNRILFNKNILKIKLFDNSEFKTNILLNDEPINDFSSILSPKSTSKVILEFYAICIKTDSVCLLLRPINIAIKYDKCNFYNYKFIKDSDSDSEYEYNGDTEYENNGDIELTNDLFIKNNSISNNLKNDSESKSEYEDKLDSENKLESEDKSESELEIEYNTETASTSMTSSDK